MFKGKKFSSRKSNKYAKKSKKKPVGRVVDTKSKTEIVWHGPNQTILPQEYYTKMHTKVRLIFGVTANQPFSATGLYNQNINLLASNPLASFTTTGITVMAGYAVNETPGGFTRLCNANMYFRYQVLAAKIEIKSEPQATSDSMIVTLTPSATSSQPSNVGSASDQPWNVQRVFRSGVDENKSVKLYVPINKFLGVNKIVFDNDQYNFSASYNSTPTTPLYCVCNFQQIDLLQNTATVPVDIEVTQYYRFYDFANANM